MVNLQYYQQFWRFKVLDCTSKITKIWVMECKIIFIQIWLNFWNYCLYICPSICPTGLWLVLAQIPVKIIKEASLVTIYVIFHPVNSGCWLDWTVVLMKHRIFYHKIQLLDLPTKGMLFTWFMVACIQSSNFDHNSTRVSTQHFTCCLLLVAYL